MSYSYRYIANENSTSATLSSLCVSDIPFHFPTSYRSILVISQTNNNSFFLVYLSHWSRQPLFKSMDFNLAGLFNSVSLVQLKFNWQWKWILKQNSILPSSGSYWFDFRFSNSWVSIRSNWHLPFSTHSILFIMSFGCSPFGHCSLRCEKLTSGFITILIWRISQQLPTVYWYYNMLKNDDCNSTARKKTLKKRKMERWQLERMPIIVSF